MKPSPLNEVPPHAFGAVELADKLAKQYLRQGGDPVALFAAFAGLVSARHSVVGADCLIALDRKLNGYDASV